MTYRPAFFALLTLLSFAACVPCCGDTVAGDASQDAVVEPMVFQPGGYRVPEEGAQVPLIAGGQGGLMIIAGVRARNVDTCGVTVRARLLSLDGQLLSESFSERRLDKREDGSAEIVDDDGSHGLILFPCDFSEERAVGISRMLEVTVTDSDGRSATSRTTVVSTCGDLGEWCENTCGARNDAGVDGGGQDAGTDGGG
jgi:hypothetical protein